MLVMRMSPPPVPLLVYIRTEGRRDKFRPRIAFGGDMQTLADWDSFYVIVGSAAGALIGLQFVVMTLIAENPPKGIEEAGAAFTTPTVIHFSAVLLLSALVRVPWESVVAASIAWGTLGLCGLAYAVTT